MKKFIIAICGILIVSTAMCNPGNYAEPKNESISPYSTEWKVVGNYDKDVKDLVIYKNYLDSQMCYKKEKERDCSVKRGDGTSDDEKAVVLHLATEIYKNGAKFCTVQVQPGNSNGQQYVWLDYYYKSGMYPCYTYCEPGYDPENKCEKLTSASDEKCDTSYRFPFTVHEIIGSGGRTNNGRMTENMNVFSFANETGWGETNQPAGNQTTIHRVLGIVENIDNGVRVAPFEITGRRGLVAFLGNGIESWIYNVTTNNNTTTLCANGYEFKSGKCVLTPKCKQEQEAIQNEQIEWCNGYNYYDSEEHQEYISNGPKCKYYRCKQQNYGWKPNTNHKCVECGTDAKSGILHGECTTCKTGQIFTTSGCSDKVTSYTKEQMFKNQSTQCWLKTNPQDFAKCVKQK